ALHQAGSGGLLVEESVEIDQQMVRGAGNAGGDVIKDEVGHRVFVDEPVAGGEIEPRLPLFGRNLALDRREIGGVVHGAFIPKTRALTARANVMGKPSPPSPTRPRKTRARSLRPF